MRRHGARLGTRVLLPILLAGALLCSVAAQSDRPPAVAVSPAAASEATTGLWPRAVIVVFERRIPSTVKHRGNVGAHLRRLRMEMMKRLAGVLAEGDDVFVFADGVSGRGFRCLLDGTTCGGDDADAVEQVSWARPEAAETFLRHFLQLPRPSEREGTGAARLPDFLRVRYEQSLEPIDCLIRRHVTGPMTEGSGDAACPLEGDGIDERHSREVSRTEITFPLLIRSALDSSPRTPYRGVTLLYGLLADKDFERAGVIKGLREDMGVKRARPLEAYYEGGQSFYSRVRERDNVFGEFGIIREVERTALPTHQLLTAIEKNRDWLLVNVGRDGMDLGKGLTLDRSVLGDDWTPALRDLALSFRLAPGIPGQIQEARVTMHSGHREFSFPTSSDGNGVFTASNADADKWLATVLDHPPSNTRLDVDIALLLKGADAAAPFGWPAVPAQKSWRESIHIVPSPYSKWDVVLYVLVFVLVVLIAWWLLPAAALTIHPPRKGFTWVMGDDTPAVRPTGELPVIVRTDGKLRDWRAAPTDVGLSWEFIAPTNLPVLRPPVTLTAGDTTIAPNKKKLWKGLPVQLNSLKGGSKRALPLNLVVHFDEAAIDLSRLSRPLDARCFLHARLDVDAHRRVLRVKKLTDEGFFVPIRLRLNGVTPKPLASVRELDAIRRGGLTVVPGSTEDGEGGRRFAIVTVTNPASARGVSRPITVSLRVELDPVCAAWGSVTLSPIGQTQDELRNGKDGRWVMRFTPAGTLPDPEVKVFTMSGKVIVDIRDREASRALPIEPMPWKFDWLLANAATVGLDLGTSGTRIRYRVSDDSDYHEDVLFPLGVKNAGDTTSAEELPSLFTIDPSDRSVSRIGPHTSGVQAAPAHHRVVQSAKGRLLDSLGDKDAEQSAREDMDAYIRALADMWKTIAASHKLNDIKIVATVPWTYGMGTISWYLDTLRKAFPQALLVSYAREAECAAYFALHQRRQDHDYAPLVGSDTESRRQLVVDYGAGTVDFVLLDVRDAGSKTEIRPAGFAHSMFGGDKVDEVLLQLMDVPDGRGRLDASRKLRGQVRDFKINTLPGVLASGIRHELDLPDLPGLRFETSGYQAAIERFLRDAVTKPLEEIRSLLPNGKARVDEVLLLGRGMQFPGCRDWIEKIVREKFEAPRKGGTPRVLIPETRSILPWAVCRGALVFEHDRFAFLGDSDALWRYDVGILADDGTPHGAFGSVFRKGDPLFKFTKRFKFSNAVRSAWLVRGTPSLPDALMRRALADLRTGSAPAETVRVITRCRPDGLSKVVAVRVSADDDVAFDDVARGEGV